MSKLRIRPSYFIIVTVLTDKVQITKKCLELKPCSGYQIATCFDFEMTSSFWHYQRVTLNWLHMLDFQPIKAVCVWEWCMVLPLAAYGTFLWILYKIPKNKILNRQNLEWTKSQIGQNPELDKIQKGQNPELDKIRNGKIQNGQNPEWTKSRNGQNPELDKIHNGQNPEMDKIHNGQNSKRAKSRI